MSSRVVFSMTEDQAAALIALASGKGIQSARVEGSLRGKGLITEWRMKLNEKVTLTKLGRSALEIARATKAAG